MGNLPDMLIQGNIVDIDARRTFHGELQIENGRVKRIFETGNAIQGEPYLLPGFVDAHIHIESSMLAPGEFARVATTHGTLATVSDPHEIANVLGMDGVRFMVDDARGLPFHICFGAPSCVPATAFETAGARIGPKEVRELLQTPGIGYLSEMMNYPGVLGGDREVMEKIRIAKELGMPVDGHAPGLRGNDAISYIRAGISTDHECVTYEEARFKLEHGMKILIREGSAAKNFEALWPLINEFPAQLMFCSDDKHPDDLVRGHINQLVARAVAKGCDLFDVLQIACLNPVAHYNLPLGQLREGDQADFILVEDLDSFQVLASCWKGKIVAEKGKPLFDVPRPERVNFFNRQMTVPGDFVIPAQPDMKRIRVIEALDGEIVTKTSSADLQHRDGQLVADLDHDVLFIALVNRYQEQPPAMGMIRGFGLRKGAVASTVAHDSHNIVAVGINTEELSSAVNLLISSRGGVCAVDGAERRLLPLLIAGLMSDLGAWEVAGKYGEVDRFAREELGSTLSAPLMTLSFMALLVIPSLKMSDKGLFDGSQFAFTPLQYA